MEPSLDLGGLALSGFVALELTPDAEIGEMEGPGGRHSGQRRIIGSLETIHRFPGNPP